MTDPLCFESHSIGDGRLNWHPQVHQAFDEDLYYVLLRFEQPLDVDQSVTTLMQDAGLPAYSAYVLLGYYDAIVRFWASSQGWQNFYRAMAYRSATVPSWRHFRVAGIDYLWRGGEIASVEGNLLSPDGLRAPLLEDIEPERRHIRSIALTPGAPEAKVVSRLQAKGLILVKPREPEAKMKAMFVLQPASSTREGFDASSELSRALREDPHFRTSSIYSGDGSLGSHVVRATMADYPAALQMSNKLAEIAERLGLRTMTLLIANPDSRESDNLNNVYQLTGDQLRTAELLGLTTEQISTVPAESRVQLDALVSLAAESLVDGAEWATAKDILRSCVQQDRRLLRQALSFILDFEFYFRRFVDALFTDEWGDDWPSEIQSENPDAFRNVAANIRDKPARWPLGVYLTLLIDSARESQEIRAKVNSKLGQSWPEIVRSLLNFRNPFAHGDLTQNVSTLNDFKGEWGDSIRQILTALPIYQVLYTTTEKV